MVRYNGTNGTSAMRYRTGPSAQVRPYGYRAPYSRGYGNYRRYGQGSFRNSVRSVTMTDKGIQTYQNVTTADLVSTPGNRLVDVVDCFSSVQLRNAGVPDETDDKFYIRTGETRTMYSNANNFPVVMTQYILVPRRLLNRGVRDIASANAPSVGNPWIDPTTSGEFRRSFNIIKKESCIIKAGKQGVVTLKRFFDPPRLVTGDFEAAKAYTYSNVSMVSLVTFDCAPMEDRQVELVLALPSIKMNKMECYKVTYYLDAENNPESTITNQVVGATSLVNIFTDVSLRAASNDNGVPEEELEEATPVMDE